MHGTRRTFLRAGLAAGVGFAGCVAPPEESDDPTPTDSGGFDALGLETVAEGFTSPIAFADPPGDHWYVADQTGTIETLGGDATLLDVADRVVDVGGYDERGLLGMAFHPGYPDTPLVYLRYSAPSREGTPVSYSHTFVLAEFEVAPDGLRARADSERTVLEIPQPQANHNAGAITFGPEGYLYVGVGDGGGGGDRGPGHVEDWYDANAGGNGQDVTENLLGSILRIDVDDRANGQNYATPDDNPLVGTEGLDEHYAWGFRNPWGMSFEGDRLFVADVGQDDYEEVNLVESGGNYGWNVTEGAHCFTTEACPANTPERVREGEPLRDPILEYSHEDSIVSGTPGSGDYTFSGTSVTGGCVYRGSALSELVGSYVFADLNTGWRLFVATPSDDGGTWPIRTVESTVLGGEDLTRVFGFGRHDGELYVLGSSMRDSDDASSGGLYRLAPAP